MTVDYIIVGLGLAGIAFAEELISHNKSFVVFEDNSQNSSLVAGGMYNPVVLKRFTPVWNAKEQLDLAIPFYKKLENRFNQTYNYKVDIYRTFKSVEEQNNWFAACDKILLQDYMIPKIIKNENKFIRAPYNSGKLIHTGRIDVNKLATDYKLFLKNENILREEKFEYDKIDFQTDCIIYKEVKAKRVVFCEGFGLKENPFFNNLPMREAKGELITIHAPDLKVDYLIKSAIFVLPIGNDLYKVGATFNWTDKTKTPTEEGREELKFKLSSVINCNYKIVDHIAGIRPTIKDRRPLVGIHSEYKQLAILNGLGTRGVMIGPLMAKKLFQNIEYGEQLEKEISINRFD
ncbi:MAG: FAD-dependent oxidoreductase [Flavobacteriaceae bacterium]|nr:FAD-dependent oxidoreductase [Flavobacteriaceae bacterium]